VSVRTIRFTQEQVRDIAEVSPGDVRQWRKFVPYLAANSGKAARFTFNDVVGLGLTREFTDSLGVRISEIGPGVDALFRVLAEVRPTHLEGLIALVERASCRLLPIAELGTQRIAGPVIVAPCDPILAKISVRMMPISAGSNQTTLPFSPHAVRRG
jgi:hypothetical protein